MKRIISFLLALLMSLSLCACGNGVAKADRKAAENVVIPIAEEHGITDLSFSHFEETKLYLKIYFTSKSFASMDDEDKLWFLEDVDKKIRADGIAFPEESNYDPDENFWILISSGNGTYDYGTNDGKATLARQKETDRMPVILLKMDSEYASEVNRAAEQSLYESKKQWEESQKKKDESSSDATKCSRCNGTGAVRYNYGSSDLEAVLSGNDPYTYGTCGSCGGTGRAK